jgi:hydrogenase maturation protein HypF
VKPSDTKTGLAPCPLPGEKPGDRTRLLIRVRGAVQGVGFRPFVYRLAQELRLAGSVQNTAQGVTVDIEGRAADVETFLLRLDRDRPPRSYLQSLEPTELVPCAQNGFAIRPSDLTGLKSAVVTPDIATCPQCLQDIFDPANRRFRYPFTNCTHCGPRFSIIEALPYDRANTSMKAFVMCPACAAEYEDPDDRRYHAQPNACPRCGPQLALETPSGEALAQGEAALLAGAEALRRGQILALKGIGGFQLLVAAHLPEAVARLRQRKQREVKPLAVMAPSLDWAHQWCAVSPTEARLLQAPEAPIVLLRRRRESAPCITPCPAVAPGNPYLGVLLPNTPLHHLLLADVGFGVVATSGNLSEEPICIDNLEARQRLGGIADLFLAHDRPIVRHVDDSVARVALGREMILRRARGYAPLPIELPEAGPATLAVGGHLKNTVAVAQGSLAFLSQHIGDLSNLASIRAFGQVAADLQRLFGVTPEIVAADAHPQYASTRLAEKHGATVFPVQHHHAHVLACMAENHLSTPVLGVAWDGTGYGLDGTIWGGEFLRVGQANFDRLAHLRTFRLPGGEQAVQEPRRCALGVLFEIYGEASFGMKELACIRAFSSKDLKALKPALTRGVNSPQTSSAGRLFDAVAALLDLRQESRFEGQAAMELEFAAEDTGTEDVYPFSLGEPESETPWVLDWEPMIRQMIDDVLRPQPVWILAARFHNTLAAMIVAVARQAGEPHVVLSGGCFQNRLLTARAVGELRAAGYQAFWHQRVPPNDGGIALGQLMAVHERRRKNRN